MSKKPWLCLLASAALGLAGCSGGGAGAAAAGPAGGGGSATTMATQVVGPLDPVQEQVNTALFTPLQDATAGSGLSGTISCANVVVNGNLLNTVDALANGLQNPTQLGTQTAAQVQMQLAKLTGNLQVLISSLASNGGCSASGSGSIDLSSALAGTPLASLGDLLPQLQNLQSQLTFGGQMGLPSLAQIVTQLQTALQSAVAQLPTSATDAPVLGGLLTSLPGVLGDVANAINATQSNPSSAPAAISTAVQNILAALTTKIIPLADLQALAGGGGSNSPLSQVTGQLNVLGSGLGTQLLGSLSGSGTVPTLSPALISQALAPVQGLVQQLVPQLTSQVGSLPGGSANPISALLNTLLPTVQGLLQGLVGPIAGGTGGGTGSCALAALPILSILCP